MKKGELNFYHTQKYRLIWDVMTQNINQIILSGGIDVTGDETTWANASYVDVHSRLMGKKYDKGGAICPPA